MDPRIGDFISKNRKRYTREAITQQLIEAGHDPADVHATWAALDTPDPDEAGMAGEGFWSRFFLFLVGLNVAVFLLVALTTGMFTNFTGGGGALAGVFAVALGIGALISWGIVAAVGPDKMGRTTATIIGAVIPLVFALLIGGSCFALAGAIGPPPLPALSGEMELQVGPPLEFEGAGEAFCQPYPDGPWFNVRAERLGTIDGKTVSASVDRYEAQINETITTVYITLVPSSENEPYFEWSEGPDSRIELSAGADANGGTVTFEDLSPMQMDPAIAPAEPMSGTITWTCDEAP
jgi:hypothetical protein